MTFAGEQWTVIAAAVAASLAGAVAAQDTAQDASFVTAAIRADLAEVQLGELAQQRGQSEAVRAYGAMLVEDHSKALEQTTALAKELGVIPPPMPSAGQSQTYWALTRISPDEFDRVFTAKMVQEHKQDIADYESRTAGSDTKVAKRAEELLPTVAKHLATAERLQQGAEAEHSREQSQN